MADKYITRAELKLPPFNISPEADNKYLEMLQDLTKKMVDNLCGQEFDQEGTVDVPVEKRVSGLGKDIVFVPKRIVQITKIRIYGSLSDYTDYTVENFIVKAKFIQWDNASDIQVSARYPVYTFPQGQYNIGIFGVWGWASVPEPIKYLQGRLIEKCMNDGAVGNKFSSERVGSYSYSLINDQTAEVGDFELDSIVKQYRPVLGYAIT